MSSVLSMFFYQLPTYRLNLTLIHSDVCGCKELKLKKLDSVHNF